MPTSYVRSAVIRSAAFAIVVLITLVGIHSRPLSGQSTTIVSAGSTWRYLDDGSNQGTAWRDRAFSDAGWAIGSAQLGYGDGDEASVVRYGADPAAKHATTYFRRTFSVANPSEFGSLNLRLLRDDGAVVYVNGSEVFRTNMPAGSIAHTTLASTTMAGGDESTFVSAAVSPSVLVAGENVIAVEVHQAERASSDLSFDLELAAGAAVAVNRGPYLQLGTPTSIVVRWRTTAPVVGRVQFGPEPGVVTGSAEETSARTDHEVRLTGLTADTLYYYSIGTPDTTLAGDATYRFRTPPLAGTERPTRVWVISDSGTANANARAVRDAYTRFTAARETDLWLMLGDNAYNDGLDHEYQAAVFNMYPAMLRSTVLWPAYGNHDGYGADAATNTGPYYDIFTLPRQAEAGGVASGTEAYYSFDHANIHFISLESFETDRSPAGRMLTWLQQDLAANTQPWVIVFFHHPPYSKGSHDSDREIELVEMRQNALPILERFGVDLVLAGHSHSYERTFLLDGHYGASSTFVASMKKDGGSGAGAAAYRKATYGMAPHEGTVYTVSGVSGKVDGGTLDHPAMYVSRGILGSLVLDINGSRLDAAFIDSTGVARDEFSILKGNGNTTPTPAPSSTPFGGTAAVVPGIIEAENFDDGGQGLAYQDGKAGNSGGVYRATDVDIQTTSDAGGGYNVGWAKAGEWLNYTVDVSAAGQYAFEARVAALGAGGRFHVEVDGVDRTGPLAVPDTGGWQNWRTISGPLIDLTAGTHVVRVVFDTSGSAGSVANLNWLRLSAASLPPPSPAYGGTPAPVPGIVEAENFDEGGQGGGYYDTKPGNSGGAYRATDVDIEAARDSGGYNVGWTKAGEWLKYTVHVAAAGTYAMEIRVANVGTGGRFHVEVDGVDRSGSVAVPDTGAWQAWQTITIGGLPLTAGQRTIRVVFESVGSGGGAGNYNWFRLVAQ